MVAYALASLIVAVFVPLGLVALLKPEAYLAFWPRAARFMRLQYEYDPPKYVTLELRVIGAFFLGFSALLLVGFARLAFEAM